MILCEENNLIFRYVIKQAKTKATANYVRSPDNTWVYTCAAKPPGQFQVCAGVT